jgi:NDP-sugar pyrophosphorylase family protein
MEVAILAGGLGTRLSPLTHTVPKALIDVNGEPFLAHQLRLLRSKGIERVVLCVSYLGEMIEEFAGDGSRFGLSVRYSFDGDKLRGTAGAIQRALNLLGEEFFILYGDSYLPCDYRSVETAFRRSGKQGLMTVFRNAGKWDQSNVELTNGSILKYDKENRSPQMHYIDYGLGAFRRAAFAGLDGTKSHDLAKIYQDLLAQGQLAAFEVTDRFYEIGSVTGLNELSEYLSLHP